MCHVIGINAQWTNANVHVTFICHQRVKIFVMASICKCIKIFML